jgi:3'-phosphoadenosine 5'-phosphosulfate sulfotransferase (PAPS reductase)/FAD synthetase
MDAKKQSLEHEDFVEIRNQARQTITRSAMHAKVERAVSEVQAFCRGKNAAYAWSGGKDSIALSVVCELAGIPDCVLGITDLEYPAFLAWVTANMPSQLEVINTGLDLDWLMANQSMLFPQTANVAAQWFSKVQHTAQRQYYRANKLDVIMVGRRRSDGNFVGRDGQNWYSADGVLRYSPLADWTHADVFACIDHFGLKMPPFYGWPRGYRCGTHPWAARQWCRGTWNGWLEVFAIDPLIVRDAAKRIPSAAHFMERNH